MSISSLGIGSGLDVRGLVDQLVAAERDPVEGRLAQRQFELTADLSAFSRVSGALSSLSSALDALADAEDFDVRLGTSSDTDAVSVSIDDGAPLGGFDVVVDRLAQRHRLGSAEQLASATFGGGVGDSLDFTVGETSFSVDLSVATDLAGVRDAIREAGAGVVGATIVTTDGDQQALVLSSSETGAAEAISISYGGSLSSATFDFSLLNTDANGALLSDVSELDAQLRVDGFTATRSDNRIDDVVEGVTLDLRAADPASTIRVDVSSDLGTLSNRMNTVVERYNALVATVDELTAFGGPDAPSGALLGDSTIRSLQTRVRDALGVGTEATETLGITSDEAGRLVFDSGAFVTQLADANETTIAALTGTDGLVTRLKAQAEAFSGDDGLIGDRTDGLDARLEDIDDARLALADRLQSVESRLLAQFTALDGLIASFNTTGSFLAQQLENLPGSGGN